MLGDKSWDLCQFWGLRKADYSFWHRGCWSWGTGEWGLSVCRFVVLRFGFVVAGPLCSLRCRRFACRCRGQNSERSWAGSLVRGTWLLKFCRIQPIVVSRLSAFAGSAGKLGKDMKRRQIGWETCNILTSLTSKDWYSAWWVTWFGLRRGIGYWAALNTWLLIYYLTTSTDWHTREAEQAAGCAALKAATELVGSRGWTLSNCQSLGWSWDSGAWSPVQPRWRTCHHVASSTCLCNWDPFWVSEYVWVAVALKVPCKFAQLRLHA